jgi:hypothetical protein
MIRFTCPCGKSLSAREEHAGETTRCPDCDRELTIPAEEGVQASPAARDAADEGIRRTRPERDDVNDERRPTKTSGMAIASLVLGIVSVVLCCSVFAGLPAIILGALGLSAIGRSHGRLTGKGLAIAGIITGGLGSVILPVQIGLLLPAVQKVREAATRMQSMNNLKQMTLAMHGYNEANGMLPSAAICDKNGKHLLSWRVAILPFIEQENLYRQFKLDEPWDGPNNSKLIALMPKTYALPSDAKAAPGYTYFRVFVGNGAAFNWCQGVSLAGGFKDGTSNTILVAEAATAVPWTKPDELDFDPNGPAPALGGHFAGGFLVGMADGLVRQVPKTVGPQTLKAAITRDAGDTLGPDW